jgi:hypothetical protein
VAHDNTKVDLLEWAEYRVKSRTINTREEAGDLTLPDGAAVPVRAIRPDDAPALQRLYGRLSKQSIHLRFFGYMKQLPDHMAKHLACVDGINRFALVALDPTSRTRSSRWYASTAKWGHAKPSTRYSSRIAGRGTGSVWA